MGEIGWTFWIIAGGLIILAILPLMLAFLRGGSDDGSAADYDLRVYRDQLRELDRDVEKGTVPEAEAERLRTEISRRILEADRARAATPDGMRRTGPVLLGGLGIIAVVGGASALYLTIGAPGYGDLPQEARIALIEEVRATRPSQAEFESTVEPSEIDTDGDPDRARMVEQLRQQMERAPEDPRGWELLAIEEARQGNFRAARLAQGRLIALVEEPTAAQQILLAEFMIRAANGYVSPEAEAALEQGLAIEPTHPWGRYYVGLMYAQQNRPDLAYPVWRNLLAESAPGAPWLQPIRMQIEEVAFLAGSPVNLEDLPQPGAMVGPSAAEIESAADLSPQDRMAMIGEMVAGLSDRLANEGGTPDEWARLVRSLRVLGEDAQADAILAEARNVYADAPEALAVIEAAATGQLAPDPMGRAPANDLPDLEDPE